MPKTRPTTRRSRAPAIPLPPRIDDVSTAFENIVTRRQARKMTKNKGKGVEKRSNEKKRQQTPSDEPTESATESGRPSKRREVEAPADIGDIAISGNASSSAAETSSTSSTLVIPEFLQQKNIRDWSTNDVFTFLDANKNIQFGDGHINAIRDQEVAGIALLTLSETKLTAQPFNLKFGPAMGIEQLITNLKVAKGLAPQEPPPKMASLDDGLTLKKAVEKAKLTNKAVMNGYVDLSLLNKKEKATVLGFLGQEVEFAQNSFAILFRTARELKNTEIQDVISVSSDSGELPVVRMPKLFVRDSYKNLYGYIEKIFRKKPLWSANRMILTGTSGIGKSAFLVYFTVRLLAESNGDNPPIIIFHAKGANPECYAFGGRRTFRTGSISDFGPLIALDDTWYLVDSVSNPILCRAKTIIAVSPKTLHSGTNEYQEVTKLTPSTYYLEPWTLDELEECRSKVFTVVPRDFVEKLYNKIGGVPRYVLQAAASILERDPNDLDRAEEDACSRVMNAIGEIKKPSMLLQYVAQAKNSLEFSSRLLHHWPHPDDPSKSYVKWASNYILQEINEQLDAQTWGEVLKGLVKEDNNGSLKGRLFEMYVGHIFRKGGYVFDVKKLQDNTSSRLKIPNNPVIKYFRKLDLSEFDEQREVEERQGDEEEEDLAGERLLLPSNPNHPCIDLCLTPDNMFQITVSPKHPIKQTPLKNIVDKIRKSDRKPRLYFIVPADIYDNFGLQNYNNEKGEVSKAVPQVIKNRVEQWALKFDIKSATIGKSPGVGNGQPF